MTTIRKSVILINYIASVLLAIVTKPQQSQVLKSCIIVKRNECIGDVIANCVRPLKNKRITLLAYLLFSRPYWVVRSRLWYDVLSVCHLSVCLSVCDVLYCG